MNSFTEENYLKAIYKLSEKDELVTTTDIASLLNIRAATVTDMLKKLAVKKLIRYERYKGLHLTEKGKAIGVRIIRKHRLWEVFLVKTLHFKWDEVHDIAEQLEHIQSDELINRLDEMLGFPKSDPHGDPIPDKHGVFGKQRAVPLSQSKPGTKTVVTGVMENKNEFLKHLDKIGIGIGDQIIITSVEAYDRSHRISVNDGKEFYISEPVAKNILVQPG